MSADDPIAFAQDLIRARSITPDASDALDRLDAFLAATGFAVHRLPFQDPPPSPPATHSPPAPEVDNLFAVIGTGEPHLCFVGHLDVVPPGKESDWRVPPWEGRVEDGVLHGRGASDMKGAVAAFAVAARRWLGGGVPKGRLSLLITGDEEGAAINGVRKVLPWMVAKGHMPITDALIGEPTNPERLGEAIKIGRRGSFNADAIAQGVQGHAAYPQLARNPLPIMARFVLAMEGLLDEGADPFEPSTCVFTAIETDNRARNVIPAQARARFNIRFNTNWTPETLLAHARKRMGTDGTIHPAGTASEAFVFAPGRLANLLADAVERRLGRRPAFSVAGGTSDGRFVKDYAPVAEFGLVGATMHKVDEQVAVQDVRDLAAIYQDLLAGYFA